MFYITHVGSTDAFGPAVHIRQDLNVFKVTIQHKEGKPPTAHLEVAKPTTGAGAGAEDILAPGQRFFFSYQHEDTNHLVFAGRVQNEPRLADGNLWLLDLMADSSTSDLKAVEVPYKRFPHWDPLFLSASQQDTVQGLIPHYSRTAAVVRMVDPFQTPTATCNLHGNFYCDTLVVHPKDPPYKKIHGEIIVEWVQRYHGLTDISRMLVREFPEGVIATLTADDFQKRWWKPQQEVKQTGYKIVQAYLTPVTPAVAGVGGGNPRQSVPFMVQGQEITVPCQWFEPTLVVEWQYRQKRREVLRFTIHNPDPGAVGEHTITFHLQDIMADNGTPHWQMGESYGVGAVVQYGDRSYRCLQAHTAGTHFTVNRACWEPAPQRQCALEAPWRSSFFTTLRGQQAFEHALYQARCLMRQQRRSTEVTFTMPLADALTLDLGQSIQATDMLQGQVTAYEFLLDGSTGAMEAKVTLAQSLSPAPAPVVPAGYTLAFGEIGYKPYADQLPKHGILNPQNLRSEDLVKAVLYKNLTPAQNEFLRGQTFPSITAAHDLLAINRTALQIHLQDLVSSDVLEHGIEVEMS